MEPRELTLTELQSVNGGTDNSSNTAITLQSSTDSMLSLDYQWSQGDRSYQMHIEAGKNVHTDFHVFNNRIS